MPPQAFEKSSSPFYAWKADSNMAEISVGLTKLDPDPLNMYIKTMTHCVLEYAQHSHTFIFYN